MLEEMCLQELFKAKRGRDCKLQASLSFAGLEREKGGRKESQTGRKCSLQKLSTVHEERRTRTDDIRARVVESLVSLSIITISSEWFHCFHREGVI